MSCPSSLQRIGVFGGAFDPPHLAHLALAQAAVAQLQLTQIRIVPTGQAWHKPRTLTDATHRLAMAELAFQPMPQAVVDACETLRDGPSYTIDTLHEFHAEMPNAQLMLIIGADQAQALPSWKSWQNMVQIATICIALRPYSISSSGIFDAQQQYPSRFQQIVMPKMNISGSDIRTRLSTRQDVSAMVSPSVLGYIAHHHLYQTI